MNIEISKLESPDSLWESVRSSYKNPSVGQGSFFLLFNELSINRENFSAPEPYDLEYAQDTMSSASARESYQMLNQSSVSEPPPVSRAEDQPQASPVREDLPVEKQSSRGNDKPAVREPGSPGKKADANTVEPDKAGGKPEAAAEKPRDGLQKVKVIEIKHDFVKLSSKLPTGLVDTQGAGLPKGVPKDKAGGPTPGQISDLADILGSMPGPGLGANNQDSLTTGPLTPLPDKNGSAAERHVWDAVRVLRAEREAGGKIKLPVESGVKITRQGDKERILVEQPAKEASVAKPKLVLGDQVSIPKLASEEASGVAAAVKDGKTVQTSFSKHLKQEATGPRHLRPEAVKANADRPNTAQAASVEGARSELVNETGSKVLGMGKDQISTKSIKASVATKVAQAQPIANETSSASNSQQGAAVSGPAGSKAAAATPPKAFQGQLFKQVEDGLLQAYIVRPKSVSVQLMPEELGEMKVKVTMEQEQIMAKIQADSQKVVAILKDNQASLEHRMREQGMELSQFEVEHDEQRGFQDRESRDQSSDGSGRGGEGSANNNNETDADDVESEALHPEHLLLHPDWVEGEPISITV